MNDVLATLTSAQRDAVTFMDGPLLILAGPGSGKTRVITHRVAHMLQQGVSPQQILALTFTNKAADEMRERVRSLAPRQEVWMGTFHRFCAQLLRSRAEMVGLAPNFTIYDADDSLRTVKRAIKETEKDAGFCSPDQVMRAISWAKNNFITHDRYKPSSGSPLGETVKRVYPVYQDLLLASNAVDFDDLLVYVATLLKESDEIRADLDDAYRYVMVDEYQDTNLTQYAIVRAISHHHPNLAVTGDPDQSIYGWRGANLSNILEFENDYPSVRVVRLEDNYRSTARICHVADVLISHNTRRKEKTLIARQGGGRQVRLIRYATHREEADAIADRVVAEAAAGKRRLCDFAVFYRINALSRVFEDALRARGVPYQIVSGVEFWQRKEIKDVVAYLQLLCNPRDDNAFSRIVNVPTRGIGKTTLERLSAHARRRRICLLDAAREAGVVESISKRSAVAVAKFAALYDRLAEGISLSLEKLMTLVLTESGYLAMYQDSDAPDDQERAANITELVTAGREFDVEHPDGSGLEAFLEQAALVNDVDDWEEENECVTLMTLHAAKGLEFPVVFIVAVEQGILPVERARDDEDRVEEERRLLFVGITRAKEDLDISFVRTRQFRGSSRVAIPSPFLENLPRDEMELVGFAANGRNDGLTIDYDGAQDGADAPWTDEEFDQTAAPVNPGMPQLPGVQLTTAADMLAFAEGKSVSQSSSDEFETGMAVIHPEYHIGKIVSISGSGAKRMATVNFVEYGQKRFLLSKSPLRPVRR